jgi:hypothetical protein
MITASLAFQAISSLSHVLLGIWLPYFAKFFEIFLRYGYLQKDDRA